MADVELKTQSPPTLTLSLEEFRTNVNTAPDLFWSPKSSRTSKPTAQRRGSVLGACGHEEYELDVYGNVRCKGPKKRKRYAHQSSFGRTRMFFKRKEGKRADMGPEKYCKCYAYTLIQALAASLAFLYFLWVLYTFGVGKTKLNQGADGQKFHAVIPKAVRLPSAYEYNSFPDNVNKATKLIVELDLWGPFLSQSQQEREYDDTQLEKSKAYVLKIVLERWTADKLDRLNRPAAANVEGGLKRSVATATLVMKNDSETHERSALDYNDLPRKKISLDLSEVSSLTPGNRKVGYFLGFGVDKAQNQSVPFSYKYKVDILTMRTRVVYSLLPLFIFVTMLIVGVKPALAALLSLLTSFISFPNLYIQENKVEDILDCFDYDYILYIVAMNLLGTLITETNVHSAIAFQLLKATRMNMFMVVVAINATAILCYFFNNILMTELFLPVVMRIYELMGTDCIPGIINMLAMYNLIGRAYVGTYAAKQVVNHHSALNAKTDEDRLTPSKLGLMMSGPVTFCAVVIGGSLMVIMVRNKPYQYTREHQIEENEQLMRLCDVVSQSIPDHSKGWHRVRLKLRAMKAFFAYEIKELRVRIKKYGPEPEKSIDVLLAERRTQCVIRNWFLLIKCILVLILYLVVFGFYFQNKSLVTGDLYEEFRLGYIAIFLLMSAVLMVHSRELELLLKRLDWDAIITMICLTFIVNVAVQKTLIKMPAFLWSMYGENLVGSKREKKHITMVYILGLVAVSGILNEFTVFSLFLDTVYKFSIYQALNSYNVVLASFLLGTGFWGMATKIGTVPNLLAAGKFYSQGYQSRISFWKFMFWGLPIAFFSIVLLYFFLLLRLAFEAKS